MDGGEQEDVGIGAVDACQRLHGGNSPLILDASIRRLEKTLVAQRPWPTTTTSELEIRPSINCQAHPQTPFRGTSTSTLSNLFTASPNLAASKAQVNSSPQRYDLIPKMPTQKPTRVSARIADSSYKPTHPKPTFRGFMDLPLELQMHVFTLAAGKLSKEGTHVLCFRLDSGRTGYLGISRSLGVDSSAQALRIGATRRRLIGTCKLARLMILEVWRKEMKAANMHEILRGFPGGVPCGTAAVL